MNAPITVREIETALRAPRGKRSPKAGVGGKAATRAKQTFAERDWDCLTNAQLVTLLGKQDDLQPRELVLLDRLQRLDAAIA